MSRIINLSASIVYLLLSSSVSAQTIVLGRFGYWESFGGTSVDGTQICGVSTLMTHDRFVGIKYFSGTDYFIIQVMKKSWVIPRNTQISVQFYIGENTPWDATAVGRTDSQIGGIVEFKIPASSLRPFF